MRVLVVEDHRKMQEITGVILKALGFDDVVTVGSTESALEQMAQSEFDLILSDFHLTGADGLQLYKAITDSPTLADIPFLLMTADPSLAPVVKAAKQGVHLLNKPFAPARLETALRNLLGADSF